MRFRQLNMRDGLPAYGTRSLAQDEDGFIWIGTDKGLCRYDGVRVRTFQSAARGWDHPYVAALAVTHRNVWVGTDHGAWQLDRLTEQIKPVPGLTGSKYRVKSMGVSAGDSALWMVVDGRGVYSYQPLTGQLHHYPMAETKGQPDFVYCDSEGGVWVLASTCAQPLWRLNRANRQFAPVRLSDPSLISNHGTLCMLVTSDGRRYIGSYHGGLWRLETDGHLTAVMPARPDGTARLLDALAETPSGQVLMATGGGLLSYNPHTGEVQHVPMSSHEGGSGTRFLHSLLVDTEGGIWCGTYYGGVTYISPLSERFRCETAQTRHASPLRLQGNMVETFCEDGRGYVWVGTDDGGLSLYDPAVREFVDFADRLALAGKNVHALLCEGDYLWVGTYTSGIYRLHIPTGRVVRHYTTTDGLPDNSCYAFCRDSQGRLWASTFGSIVRFDEVGGAAKHGESIGRFTSVRYTGTPASELLDDGQGSLWVGTEGNGLWRLHLKTARWEHYGHQPDDMINDLALDQGRRLWVSTGNGLFRYEPRGNRFTPFRAGHNLPSDDICQLICDDETFWISTSNGLAKLYGTDSVHVFNQEDGLPVNQFLPAAGIMTSDGLLFFGTTDGFCFFRPTHIRLNRVAPAVFITGLNVLGKDIATGSDLLPHTPLYTDQITLSHEDASFTIDFAALSFAAPQKNSYYYALEGYDTAWVSPVTPNATYSSLPSGTYVFHVRATNNDGIWSYNEARLRIVVRQPWWWSGAARAVYAALLLAGLGVYLYLRQRRLQRRARQMASVDKDLLPRLTALIDGNLNNPQLSVAFLADQLGMSRTAFFSKLKLVTKLTPNEMIQQARLDSAARLLREGGHTVTEVCQAVGMTSPSYFSRCFQRQFGCKPSEYIKNSQKS